MDVPEILEIYSKFTKGRIIELLFLLTFAIILGLHQMSCSCQLSLEKPKILHAFERIRFMRICALAAFAMLLLTGCRSQQVIVNAPGTWNDAWCDKIKVGSSTRADVIDILGKPANEHYFDENGDDAMCYSAVITVMSTWSYNPFGKLIFATHQTPHSYGADFSFTPSGVVKSIRKGGTHNIPTKQICN